MLTRFHLRPWARRCVIAACVAVIAVQWVVIMHRRAKGIGDFDVSREFGRRFLAREYLYAGGTHYPYMPSAAMYFAPLAMVNPTLGLALRYAVAVGCLWLTFHLLWSMVRDRAKGGSSRGFEIATITTLLASHYIVRDLDDGGPHLILLAVLVGGIQCVWRGRDGLGAMWFGLATALKAPAGLFLPFFLWKRQWRLAAWTAAATACWILLPVVWMGPTSWWNHQREWSRVALGSALGDSAPVADLSERRVQNQALRPAVMRFLVTYPDGHPLRLSHPAYVSVLDLSPVTSGRLATGAVLGLVAICAWYGRQRYDGPADPRFLLECSAVLILALLLAPVAWLQHLVQIVPALYVTVAERQTNRKLGRPATTAMWGYMVLAVVLNREMLGRDVYLLLLSYHIHTIALLLVLGVLLLRRPTVG
ncbi:MAG: DUF2029 domain-containing protein [candidate division NC10 bacterium]|nr:DUF2029 domain-containing protein [candidate division NC10 bacterium]